MVSRNRGFSPMIIIIVVAVIVGAGGYFLYMGKPQQKKERTVQQQGNIVSSIKDALSKSASLKCEYPDKSGNKVVTYVKAGAVRVDGYAATGGKGPKGHAILKDEKFYIWNDGSTQGTLIVFKKEDLGKATKERLGQSKDQKQEFLSGLEKYRNYCKKEAVSASLFDPPANVKFLNLEEELKKSGFTPPSEEETVVEEEIE